MLSSFRLVAGSFFDQLVKRVPFVKKALDQKQKWTWQLQGRTDEELILSLSKRFNIKSEADKQKLHALLETKEGKEFFHERVDAINRESFHRSAFAFNAAAQLAIVDMTSILLPLPWWQIKLGLAGVNGTLALYANHRVGREFKQLMRGPQKLPPKRWLFGMLRNRAYNKAVVGASKAYKRDAWRENILYRSAYFVNGATLVVGGQSNAPLLIGTAFNWLVTYPLAAANTWYGVTSGTNALRATQSQNATLGKLQV